MSVLAPPPRPPRDDVDALIEEARARARRRLLFTAAALVAVAGLGLAGRAAIPGGGDSFVMQSRGPVQRVIGYVSDASARSRIGIDDVGSSGGVTWASNSDGTTWLTTNGGRSWRSVGQLQPAQFVDKRHGWATGPCGVERTIDGGHTWRCSSPKVCPDRCGYQSISFLDARHGFVLEGARQVTRLFRTSDGRPHLAARLHTTPMAGADPVRKREARICR